MVPNLPRSLQRLAYARSAEAYLRSLPLEHFMEAAPQATQREICVESLALVKARRPEVQYFNELLIQYPFGRPPEIRKIVPDNFVILHAEPLNIVGSYDLPFQPVRPFWTLEYVSKQSQRKDYEDSFVRYERELKVPYYLHFYPDEQELSLFRLTTRRYRSVTANAAGRFAIAELDLELALRDGWVRFWFRGELLPLPADLQKQLDEIRLQLQQAQAQVQQAQAQVQQAQAQAQQAQAQADHERQQKERLLAQLRELGAEPRL
jgi:Uma2 family endonuclease